MKTHRHPDHPYAHYSKIQHGVADSRVRAMSEVEKSWVGAAIDTDGSISPYRKGWAVAFTNTEIELVSTLLRVTGVGYVGYRPTNSGWGYKPRWEWKVSALRDAPDLLDQIRPYSIKAQRCKS